MSCSHKKTNVMQLQFMINLFLVLLHVQLYRTCVMIMTDANIQCKQLQCTKLIIKIVSLVWMIFKIINFTYDYCVLETCWFPLIFYFRNEILKNKIHKIHIQHWKCCDVEIVIVCTLYFVPSHVTGSKDTWSSWMNGIVLIFYARR